MNDADVALTYSVRSSWIAAIQRLLNSHGFSVPVDGVYEPVTETALAAAIAAMQKSPSSARCLVNGIHPDSPASLVLRRLGDAFKEHGDYYGQTRATSRAPQMAATSEITMGPSEAMKMERDITSSPGMLTRFARWLHA